MPELGDFWWVPIVAAAIGGFLMPLRGYLKHQPNGGASSPTIHGATIIDSSIVREAVAVGEEQVIVLRRIAEAADRIVNIEDGRETRNTKERHDAELSVLRRELEELKRKM